jgi:hypothetical protein
MEHVYIVTNAAWPEHVKIGLTTKAPAKRLSQYNTGSPHRDYVMEYQQPIADSRALEAEVHANLRDMGIESRNEWFKLPVPLAVSMVATAVSDLD